MTVQQLQLGVEKKGREQEIAGIFAIDLKDHDLLFVFADHGSVYLVIVGKADLGGIEFDGFAYFAGLAVQFDGGAMNDAFFLVFVDEVKKVVIGDKVDVDVFIGHEGKGYPLLQFHVIVIDTDGVTGIIVLEYQEVAIDLADNLKIGTAAILPFGFSVGDLLDLGLCYGGHRQGKSKQQG
jgi:hypothetical protein